MDRPEAMRVAASDASVSDRIRILDAAGYPRAEIARLIGRRYQHVRNVLEGDKLRRTTVAGVATGGVGETGRRFEGACAVPEIEDRGGGAYRLSVREDGSVVLPPAVRAAFGLTGPGSVMARLDGEEFKVIGAATALRRVQERLKPYRRTERPLASDELIAERRSGEMWGD